jgi:hypothetical protein
VQAHLQGQLHLGDAGFAEALGKNRNLAFSGRRNTASATPCLSTTAARVCCHTGAQSSHRAGLRLGLLFREEDCAAL